MGPTPTPHLDFFDFLNKENPAPRFAERGWLLSYRFDSSSTKPSIVSYIKVSTSFSVKVFFKFMKWVLVLCLCSRITDQLPFLLSGLLMFQPWYDLIVPPVLLLTYNLTFLSIRSLRAIKFYSPKLMRIALPCCI